MKSNYIDRSRQISCHEAHGMIRDYLDRKLSERDLAAFLNHIRDCSSCYNDLETEFMVDQTVKYLNEKEIESFNLGPLLHEDIRKRTEWLLRKRKMRKLRLIILLVTIILGGVLFLNLTGILRFSEITAFFAGLS